MRVAGQIAIDLHGDCIADPTLRPHVESVADSDLGQIAEAIYAAREDSQQAVLEALGIPNPEQWPGTPEVDPHICALRVLSRAVREQEFLEKAVGFNYDCCSEAALKSEGFRFTRETTAGRLWLDHADIICSKEGYQDTAGRDGYELVKAHGCAEHYREAYAEDASPEVAESIVIRATQIDSWEGRLWACDALRDRVRTGILLLVGFSGQDPATTEELKRVLKDVYAGDSASNRPRLVVIDHKPDADALRELIDYGIGPDGKKGGEVTEICTASSSTTAVLLVLLAEMIALELQPSMEELGYTLPPDLDGRLALLALAGPPMARWSFLLEQGASRAFMQQVNAAMAEELTYVPLRHNPRAIVRALKIRDELRRSIGLNGLDGAESLCETDGFIVHRGRAYLPLGLDLNTITDAHRDGALERAKDVLPWPRGLTAILVCEEGGVRRGVSLEKGQEVHVP